MVAFILLGTLVAAAAVLLAGAQNESRQSAERHFSERARTSAALTQSVFSALGSPPGKELARRYGGPSQSIRSNLSRQLRQSQVRYVAVIGARGKVLAAVGRPPRRLALAGTFGDGPRVSDVVRAGETQVVERAIPFNTPTGPRAIVDGVPLSAMATSLRDSLARLPNVDDAGLAVTDRRGVTISRQGRISPSGPKDPERLATTAGVPGTPWTLRVEAGRDQILEGANRRAWLPWLLLTALALAGLAGIALYVRVLTWARRQRRAVRRQREANSALNENRDQIRNLVEALEEAVVLHHADGKTELLNDSAKKLLNTEAGALSGLAPGWEPLDEDGAPLAEVDLPLERVLTTGTPQNRIIGQRHSDGSRRWLRVRARPLVRPGEELPHAVVASYTDITEQREMHLHLTDLAQRDPLTGLWNRRRFEGDLARQLDRCRRYGERAALVMLDLDGFKQVNDTLGHHAGDEVLRALADGLSSRLRSSDSAARLGGDEFAVLLLNADEAEARGMAMTVAARLTQFAREQLGADLELSLSVGVAVLDGNSGNESDVIAAADRAMYADKRRSHPAAAARQEYTSPPHSRAGAEGDAAGGSETSHPASLRALLAAVQARNSYAALHLHEVVTRARAVAGRLGLDEGASSEVETVALLHDLGTISVPDAILLKRGPLNDDELSLMRQHPVAGARMVSPIPELERLAPAIRAAHERWDGRGYPDGLAGDAIPLPSRIAFVCDAYHAMISDRPYRGALSRAEAVDDVVRESGHKFCPTSAGALL
ncbi:MAG: diguanylate cyclase, partial [Solirubrobacteraceae bacterium]